MRSLSRKPTNIKDGSDPFIKPYDAVICAHGFEERSCAFAERFVGKARQKIALGFTDRQVLSFSRNAKLFEQLNYRLLTLNERELADWWKEWLSALRPEDPSTGRICIDISSQTRTRLALLVEGLCNYQSAARIDVDFVYSLAEFSEPGPGNEVAEVCGPVTPFFAGWPRDPDLPTAAIIGLGYETDRAIGAYEYLEPTTRLLLLPRGQDVRYDTEVRNANESILTRSAPREQFSYQVDKPAATFELLESLTYGLLPDNRLILLPFGPKMFALSCLLTSAAYFPEVGVWRVSPGTSEEPRQRRASESTIVLSVLFDGSHSSLR